MEAVLSDNEMIGFLICVVALATVMTTFMVIMCKRMIAQLSPDAQLKPVKTVLIEGEVLDIIIEPELSPNTT